MNKVLPKTLSRYLAVQSVYNFIISSEKDEIINNFNSKNTLIFIDFEKQIKKKNINKSFFLKIFNNFCEKKISIDELISKNLNGKWSLGRLPLVISAVLSVAVSEIILFPKTSIKIIVSEYLEIAESFHNIDEIKFINAILDKIYKEIHDER
jgi:N utilization substance protein B|tara:strand:- start:148 stop:603 length:456 start_codon:yes stop_codon:yes gene_type:complete